MSIDQSHSVEETAFPARGARSEGNPPHEVEASLHASELKYQRLVEGIGGDYVIYTHDPEGIITYVSPSIEHVLGFPVKAVLGLNWRDLIGEHFVGRDLAERVSDEVAEGKQFYSFVVEMSHADGSTLLVEIQQHPLFDEAGQYTSMEGIAKDITEATRDAEELQRLKEDLEQRVADRTAELIRSNERLREKEAHLALVSRLATMGELVAGMAHEIHQPLHAAKTFSEAARRNLEMGSAANIETAIDCTREISEAISRTASIIRRLREFTHSRPRKFELLDLNHVVQEAIELTAYEARKSGVKLDCDLAANLPTIQGDLVQLIQISVNLLINAFEAMAETPDEQRLLQIRSHCDETCVRLEFCDAGRGVAEDALEKLYDAFYTTKNQGMGMGLSLCKSIAMAHGGRIWGKRNERLGMTFVLELPLPRRRPSDLSRK